MTKTLIANGIAMSVRIIVIMNLVNTLCPDDFKNFIEKEQKKRKDHREEAVKNNDGPGDI